MAYALFITRNDIIKNTPLQGSIDADRLLNFVRTAQDKYILNLLGTVLFDKLQLDIANGTFNQLDVYYQFKSEGAVKHETETAKSVTKNEVDYLLQKSMNNADYYATRMQNYLISYSNQIPEYYESVGNQTQIYPDMGNAYFGGINL
jgi:hypothetical protein